MEGRHGGTVILKKSGKNFIVIYHKGSYLPCFKKNNLLDLPERNYCGTPRRQVPSMVEEESEIDVYRNVRQAGRVWARIKKLHLSSLRFQSKTQIERRYLNTKLPQEFCVYMDSIRNV